MSDYRTVELDIPWLGIAVVVLIIAFSFITYLDGHDRRNDNLARYKAKVAACTHLQDQARMQKCIKDS